MRRREFPPIRLENFLRGFEMPRKRGPADGRHITHEVLVEIARDAAEK
jgi:hypothetical protein